jgi:hypothetical protein
MSSMSSDGIRKQTLAWEISPSGGMSRGGGQVVNIDDVPAVSAAIPIDSGAIVVEEPVGPPEHHQRQRRSTLDTFNDEMAVLERPLEGDVEYVDEKPPTRWRAAAAFITTVAIVGGGGAFMIHRHRAGLAAHELPSRPAAVTVGAPPPSPVAVAQAAAAPAPGPTAVAKASPVEDAIDGDDAEPAADTRSGWSKVKSQQGHGGHSKHVRSASKSSRHHSKHAAASKHGSRH